MAGHYSGPDFDGVRVPRKPALKSVALPAGSPLNSPTVPNHPSRFSWIPGLGHTHNRRSQTPVPAPNHQRRDPSFHEASPPVSRNYHNAHTTATTTRTRKSSVSSNTSDRSNTTAPLKGILKKPGSSSSRSSTPAPPGSSLGSSVKSESMVYPKSSSSTESGSGHHHRKASSSSSFSKPDGYSSDTTWKRKLSHEEEEAPKSSMYNGRKATPSAVPMKSEDIALSWPLTEPSRNPRKQRISICFDVAFDPRKSKGVTIPLYPDVAHRTDMPHDMIRMPASTHCKLGDMRIYLEDFRCWPIKVKRKEGIRCLDVFEAVYKTLQHRLTDEDVRTFGEARIQRCYNFFLQRCADSPGLKDYNIQYGMRRVDLLRGRRFFRGLVQSGEEWTLLLDDYSGSSRH
jgi:hypothetical protein